MSAIKGDKNVLSFRARGASDSSVTSQNGRLPPGQQRG